MPSAIKVQINILKTAFYDHFIVFSLVNLCLVYVFKISYIIKTCDLSLRSNLLVTSEKFHCLGPGLIIRPSRGYHIIKLTPTCSQVSWYNYYKWVKFIFFRFYYVCCTKLQVDLINFNIIFYFVAVAVQWNSV